MAFYVKQQFCPEDDPRLQKPIAELLLSKREIEALEKSSVKTVGDALRFEGSLERVPGFGRKGAARLTAELSDLFGQELVHG